MIKYGICTSGKIKKESVISENLRKLLLKAAKESRARTDCQNVAADILRFNRTR